jgi:murein DD-endopeptidase MepM/ murein hydrolase activator NlpD
MYHYYRLSTLVLLLALVSACGGGVSGKTIMPNEQSTPTVTSAPVYTSTISPPELPSPAKPSPEHPIEHSLYFTSTPTTYSSATASPTILVSQVCSPLQGHSLTDLREIITNPFDPPPPGKDTGHHGVDFAYYRRGERLSISGVPVQAVLSGKVAAGVNNRIPYGNMAIVETGQDDLPEGLAELLKVPAGRSVYLLYAHMKEPPTVILGSLVKCGQTLGEVGNTPKGWSSNPHLHLEVRVGPAGVLFNGMVYYDNSASLQELENYKRWRMSGDFSMFDPMKLLEWGLSKN